MRVYAFEWCGCVHESGFGVVSLHTTKRGALKAMVRGANDRWLQARDIQLSYRDRRPRYDPLMFEAWRVVELKVVGDEFLHIAVQTLTDGTVRVYGNGGMVFEAKGKNLRIESSVCQLEAPRSGEISVAAGNESITRRVKR